MFSLGGSIPSDVRKKMLNYRGCEDGADVAIRKLDNIIERLGRLDGSSQ